MITARRAPETSPIHSLLNGLSAQGHVIGAMILRELHTRYGRDNIGYLWMLLEPGLLAASVAALHVGQRQRSSDLSPIGFALCGYCTFIIFRSIVTRAEATLESNKPLLFHRTVTIFDMVLARVLLEAISTIATLIILWAGACALGLAEPPARLLTLMGAILFLVWFSLGIGMTICAGAYLSKAFAKFVHPVMYILMPISGAFFLLSWIPQPYRDYLAWSPLMQIFEMLHTGQFETVESPYYDLGYITAWCLVTTLFGLLSLRVVRRHVHLN
jgi:capsular polysaccharide transport system permease protein